MKTTKLFSCIALLCGLTACATTSHNQATLSGTWQVTALTGEPTPDNQSYLSFDPSTHNYRAYFGCNHFSGNYTSEQQSLAFSQPVGTLMMCSNIEDERTGMATLQFVKQWRINTQNNQPHLQLLDEQNQVRIDAIPASEASSN